MLVRALVLLVPMLAAAAPIAASAREGIAPFAAQGWREYRGAVHLHSQLSKDSSVGHAEIVAAARAAGLDFALMTEHRQPPGGFEHSLQGDREGVLFLAGSEFADSEQGSLLSLAVAQQPRGASHALRAAHTHALGGLAVAGHAVDWPSLDAAWLDGIEIYNVHDDLLFDGRVWANLPRALAALWRAGRPAALASMIDRPDDALARWDEQLRGRRLPGIGGNDAHRNVGALGMYLDPYAASLRMVNTHVFARGELDRASLLEALSEGRGFVCHAIFGDGRGFAFWLEDASGRATAVVGEALAFEPGQALRVIAPQPAAGRVLRDGAVVASTQDARDWRVRVRESGVYRVELQVLEAGPVDPEAPRRSRPWIYSNPIHVRDPGATPVAVRHSDR